MPVTVIPGPAGGVARAPCGRDSDQLELASDSEARASEATSAMALHLKGHPTGDTEPSLATGTDGSGRLSAIAPAATFTVTPGGGDSD